MLVDRINGELSCQLKSICINDPEGCLTAEACSKESIGSFFKSDHEEEALVLAMIMSLVFQPTR